MRPPLRTLLGIWAAWAVILFAFQGLVAARFDPERPDTVLGWTATETGLRRNAGKPYLQEPLLNEHVAWDSEFYLSIATAGYDDPAVTAWRADGEHPIPLDYAFLPGYPFVVRAVATPLWGVAGLPAVATATIAALVVALVSALVAIAALYLLAARPLGEEGGLRAAFYLLIFPTGFFLAQVYSEAFFLALALGSLVLIDARRPLPAGALAVVATLTRPVGVALALSLGFALVRAIVRRRRNVVDPPPVTEVASWAIATILPMGTFALWSLSPFGDVSRRVQEEYFGRAAFDIDATLAAWSGIVAGFGELPVETQLYYGLEAAAVLLAIVASLWALREWPATALFGLGAILIPLASGAPQSLTRYALVVPAIFLLLGGLGRNRVFDRAWTLASVLLMGLMVTLFTFDFWVA